MSLLAPLMLLGLLGLGLPLLGHLRGKEEPRTVRFAGLRFLAAGDEVVAQRRRLRDVLLLLVRLGLLLLLVVALTRPVSIGDARVAVLGEAHDAVLLLDASFSMNLRVDGTSLRAASEDAAAAILEALPPGSRVGLVTTDPGGPRRELSADPDRVRAPLKRVGREFVPVSWEEALTDIGARLAAIRARHGADAIATYLGNPTAHDYGAALASTVLRGVLVRVDKQVSPDQRFLLLAASRADLDTDTFRLLVRPFTTFLEAPEESVV